MKTTTTTTFDYNGDGSIAKETVVREEPLAQDDLAAAIQRVEKLINSADWQAACPNVARQVQAALDGREDASDPRRVAEQVFGQGLGQIAALIRERTS